MSEWIKFPTNVKDLPHPEATEFLAFAPKGKNVYTLYHRHGVLYWFGGEGLERQYTGVWPSHWMPVPEDPKREPGLYWVKLVGETEVARFPAKGSSSQWHVLGKGYYPETSLDILERLVPPC